jgi:hypothetical protein
MTRRRVPKRQTQRPTAVRTTQDLLSPTSSNACSGSTPASSSRDGEFGIDFNPALAGPDALTPYWNVALGALLAWVVYVYRTTGARGRCGSRWARSARCCSRSCCSC